jgi:hypothetical protein
MHINNAFKREFCRQSLSVHSEGVLISLTFYVISVVMGNIGELDNLTTKINTLLEFFNFVSEFSRLQYE